MIRDRSIAGLLAQGGTGIAELFFTVLSARFAMLLIMLPTIDQDVINTQRGVYSIVALGVFLTITVVMWFVGFKTSKAMLRQASLLLQTGLYTVFLATAIVAAPGDLGWIDMALRAAFAGILYRRLVRDTHNA